MPFPVDTPKKIREKLDMGVLPRDFPEEIRASLGTGQLCDGCETRILPAQVEYQFEAADGHTVKFHLGCAGLWEAARRRRALKRYALGLRSKEDSVTEPETHAEVATLILSRIAAGSLPTVRIKKVWAGKGSGRRCDGCGQQITASEIENEVDLAGAVVMRLHGRCFTIWQEALETSAHEISGGSGRPWPLFFEARVVAQATLLTACAKARATAAHTRALSCSARAEYLNRRSSTLIAA